MDQRLKLHELDYWEVAEKPTTAELQSCFANKYYQEGKGSYELSYTDAKLAYFKVKLEQRWHVLKTLLPRKKAREPIRVFDMRCGEGYAMAFLRLQGCAVREFDFSSAAGRLGIWRNLPAFLVPIN